MTDPLDALDAAADKATHGPWVAVREQNKLTTAGTEFLEKSPYKTWAYRCAVNTGWIHGQLKAPMGITYTAIPAAPDLFADMAPHADLRWEDAEYIAMCYPERIKALIAAVRAAREHFNAVIRLSLHTSEHGGYHLVEDRDMALEHLREAFKQLDAFK